MTSLTIHCGSFKTGSSRIQNHAWTHRALLASEDWLFPETGVYRTEPDVGYRHSAFAYSHAQGTKWEALVERLISEIRDAAPARVLLSSEAWSNRSLLPSLAALLARLRAAGLADESHGIIYLRNREEYLRSHYREFTRRRGNTQPFAAYLKTRTAAIDPLRIPGALRTIFGERLAVFPYEHAGNIGTHFFTLLNLPPPVDPDAPSVVNRGLDALETEALRVLNRLAPGRRTGFPGLYAIAARAGETVDAALALERFPTGFLEVESSTIESFRSASGWGNAEVDLLLARRPEALRDVSEWTPLIERLCSDWLAANLLPARFHVEQFKHPAVIEAAIDVFPNGRERSKLGGYVVIDSAAGPGLELLADDPSGNLPLRWRSPSARIAARYPAEPLAARARFSVPLHGMDRAEGFVQLSLVSGTGQRTPIFRVTPEAA